MLKYRVPYIAFVTLILLGLACSGSAVLPPTATPLPPTETPLPTNTATAVPTATPNLTATAVAKAEKAEAEILAGLVDLLGELFGP